LALSTPSKRGAQACHAPCANTADALVGQCRIRTHARTPFSRLGRPADVAAAALFLASDECTYVSGINLLVDGGWMAY